MSNRPKDDPFHQHQLCGIHIFLDAKHVFPMFVVVGIVFICMGIWLRVEQNSIEEISIDYTHCQSLKNHSRTCSEELQNTTMVANYDSCYCVKNFTISANFKGNTKFYYKLSNFYQNYRLYVTSKDDMQLHGSSPPFKTSCDPYRINSLKENYAPCGAIPNSIFNDTFSLYYIASNATIIVPWTNVNISWPTDREELFGIPKSFANTSKPINWKFTASQRSPTAYKGDEELIVWMRLAAFPTFRKLHRILILKDMFSDGLINGTYSLYINYSFPVSPFNGSKAFFISTDHWLDSKDPAIFIIFLLSGVLYILGSLILFVIYQMNSKKRKSHE